MEKINKITYSLNEAEILEAIRYYLVNKLGTKVITDSNDIILNAQVDEDYTAHDYTAELTIVNQEEIKL